MMVRHADLADFPLPRRRSPGSRINWRFVAFLIAAVGPWALIAAAILIMVR
jgi:hypothetical protein